MATPWRRECCVLTGPDDPFSEVATIVDQPADPVSHLLSATGIPFVPRSGIGGHLLRVPVATYKHWPFADDVYEDRLIHIVV